MKKELKEKRKNGFVSKFIKGIDKGFGEVDRPDFKMPKEIKDFNNEWEARKYFGEKPFEKEIKEKCIHNAVAKGKGEKNWYCVNCGKSVEPPEIKRDWEKTATIANKYGKDGCISPLKEAIDKLLIQEKQKWVKENKNWNLKKIKKLAERIIELTKN